MLRGWRAGCVSALSCSRSPPRVCVCVCVCARHPVSYVELRTSAPGSGLTPDLNRVALARPYSRRQVIDGKWYVIVKGDYAGRVSGAIYDITNTSNPVAIPTTPNWESCKLVRRRTVSATQTALRRLLAAYTQAHKVRPWLPGGGRGTIRYHTVYKNRRGRRGLVPSL